MDVDGKGRKWEMGKGKETGTGWEEEGRKGRSLSDQ